MDKCLYQLQLDLYYILLHTLCVQMEMIIIIGNSSDTLKIIDFHIQL